MRKVYCLSLYYSTKYCTIAPAYSVRCNTIIYYINEVFYTVHGTRAVANTITGGRGRIATHPGLSLDRVMMETKT